MAACLDAFRCTGDVRWTQQSQLVFDWFLGRNDLGVPLIEPATGACYDGLQPDGVNQNQGAESTLAYLLSLLDLRLAEEELATADLPPQEDGDQTPWSPIAAESNGATAGAVVADEPAAQLP